MKITVMGSGSFGLAVANQLIKNNNKVTVWTHDIKSKDDKFNYTDDYKLAANADIIFIMTSAKYIGDIAKNLKPYVNKNTHYCIGSKGIEQGTCRFTHEVFNQYIKTKNLSIISGPSFAVDMSNNEPIGFTIATLSNESRNIIKNSLKSNTIKLRDSSDIIGIQVCGSIKNVIAVASGILSGLGFHESTRSFLIVESMHDIKELLKALGGDKKTIQSYAGIGDLLLTCTSDKSRNYSYGVLIGKKEFTKADDYLKNNTVEGYYTLKSIYTLLRRKKINMPVIDLIYKIIMNKEDPNLLVEFLINKK